MASAQLGFIGVGIMGEGMVKNILKAGRNVVMWNRGAAKCEALKAEFGGLVTVASSPGEVISACATTYSMLSTLEASEAVFPAVLEAVGPGKAIIDCATLTPERMVSMAAAVTAKGGAFLEAPVSGSKGPAAAGQLIFLCAGDEATYNAAGPELDVMGKAKFYFGEVGAGTKMKLVVNMTMGSMISALAEGAALAEASNLDQTKLLEVLDLGAMSNMMFKLKGPSMVKRDHSGTQFPLKHAQKDMRFALGLGDELAQPLPLAAAANERMIAARAQGHDDSDFSAVYEACRPNNSAAALPTPPAK